MILKSLSELTLTPRLLAHEAGTMALESVIRTIRYPKDRASIHSPRGCDRLAMSCGRGELLVRNDPHFKAAKWLASGLAPV